MEITEVKITLRDEPKLKAFANVTFDNEFVVRGIKVIEGQNGLFIAMPSRKGKDGQYRDIAHPINNEMRERLERAVIDEYNKSLTQTTTDTAQEEKEQEQE
ncbi:septation regulator SpoVG [candidate division WOR-3 bacterium]|nr:septation regulator SpoVG [candidate division WOR-3 bacterium]